MFLLKAIFPDAIILPMKHCGFREAKGCTEGDLAFALLLGGVCNQSPPTRACLPSLFPSPAAFNHLCLIGLPNHLPPIWKQGGSAPMAAIGVLGIFPKQRFSILMKSNLSGFFFSFMNCAFMIYLKKSLPNTRSQRFFSKAFF